jgi:hypothetical protein
VLLGYEEEVMVFGFSPALADLGNSLESTPLEVDSAEGLKRKNSDFVGSLAVGLPRSTMHRY